MQQSDSANGENNDVIESKSVKMYIQNPHIFQE